MLSLKHAQTMIAFVTCLTATQALSLNVSYVGHGVELVVLDPVTATFECAYNDLPAKVEINDDTFAEISISFELPLFDFEVPLQLLAEPGTRIVERRGTDTVIALFQDQPSGIDPSSIDKEADRPALSPDEWHMAMTAELDVCVGQGTLQIIHGNLDVVMQVGQYKAHILHTSNVPEDLRVRYQINASNSDPLPLILPREVSEAPIEGTKKVGSMAPEGVRSLGVVSFYDRQIGTIFTSPTDLEGVAEDTGLSVSFVLVIAVSVSD